MTDTVKCGQTDRVHRHPPRSLHFHSNDVIPQAGHSATDGSRNYANYCDQTSHLRRMRPDGPICTESRLHAPINFFGLAGSPVEFLLALALTGLYGVTALLLAQQTQEIGVRMALGASRGAILRLVMRKSLRLIVWGTLAGLAVALAGSRVLSSLLFGVGPYDPMTFALVTLLLVFVGLVAAVIPARSAARIEPVDALRAG